MCVRGLSEFVCVFPGWWGVLKPWFKHDAWVVSHTDTGVALENYGIAGCKPQYTTCMCGCALISAKVCTANTGWSRMGKLIAEMHFTFQLAHRKTQASTAKRVGFDKGVWDKTAFIQSKYTVLTYIVLLYHCTNTFSSPFLVVGGGLPLMAHCSTFNTFIMVTIEYYTS